MRPPPQNILGLYIGKDFKNYISIQEYSLGQCVDTIGSTTLQFPDTDSKFLTYCQNIIVLITFSLYVLHIFVNFFTSCFVIFLHHCIQFVTTASHHSIHFCLCTTLPFHIMVKGYGGHYLNCDSSTVQ